MTTHTCSILALACHDHDHICLFDNLYEPPRVGHDYACNCSPNNSRLPARLDYSPQGIETLTQLSIDQDDDAMNRWKASLGLGTGEPIADPNDPRTCIIKSLSLVCPDTISFMAPRGRRRRVEAMS